VGEAPRKEQHHADHVLGDGNARGGKGRRKGDGCGR